MTESNESIPQNASDIPANPAVEALSETLEFEREQWQQEREDLLRHLTEARETVGELDWFALSNIVAICSQAIDLEATENEEGYNAFLQLLATYVDELPTPTKRNLEQRLLDTHAAYHQADNERGIFAATLLASGQDPDAILEAKRQEASEFVRTLVEGGIIPGFPPVVRDDTDIDPGDQQL